MLCLECAGELKSALIYCSDAGALLEASFVSETGGNSCSHSPLPAISFRALKRSLGHAGFALPVVLILAPVALGQLASLDKGHQVLVNSGLQVWGLDTGGSPFGYSALTGMNMN